MYLYQRGEGAKRRVMHLTGFNPLTGAATMRPLCGDDRLAYNTTINVPLARPVCKRCRAACLHMEQEA